MISIMRLPGSIVFSLLLLFQATTSFAADESEGMIYPNEVVKVSSQVSGILEEVLVERGDIVKAGQILARLKSGVEKASVELARANVAFLKRKAQRNAELAKKRLISENEHDELESELRKAELQLEEAQEKLKLRTIVSTIDGVVTERLMAPGDYVGETPIMKLASLNPLRVEVIAPARRFRAIKKGMKAEVRPEAPVGGVYIGKVTIVDKVIDAASSTFGVRIELANPNLKLPSGLRCRVRFI
jgi:membrane fusion protein (multidrug efflux system)